MLRDDQDWANLVKNIANNSANNRECIQVAVEYLWDHRNWDRLKDTWHGRFLREVNSDAPDLMLRSIFRNEVLAS